MLLWDMSHIECLSALFPMADFLDCCKLFFCFVFKNELQLLSLTGIVEEQTF